MLRIMKFDEAISQTFVHNLIKLQFFNKINIIGVNRAIDQSKAIFTNGDLNKTTTKLTATLDSLRSSLMARASLMKTSG